jgi:hypothetical protein
MIAHAHDASWFDNHLVRQHDFEIYHALIEDEMKSARKKNIA